MEKINSELGESLESIEDDTECPYGTLLSDETYHKKKAIVERFLRFILTEEVLTEYLNEVYDNEKCGNNPLDAIISNAWWWHSGGESKNYHVDFMSAGNESDDVYCVIYEEDSDQEVGNLTLTAEEARIMNLQLSALSAALSIQRAGKTCLYALALSVLAVGTAILSLWLI